MRRIHENILRGSLIADLNPHVAQVTLKSHLSLRWRKEEANLKAPILYSIGDNRG